MEIRGLDKAVVSLILLGKGERRRYVQDTPILPDVWQAYARAPADRHDLLIAPLKSRSAIAAMRALRDALAERLDFADLARAQLAPLQSFVGAKLTFDELINVVLPRTEWVVEARKRFGREKGKLPFDPDQAFEQVVRAAHGLPPRGARQLRGQLFEIARVLTLISAIYVSQDPELGEIVDVGQLEPLRERIVKGVVELLGALAEIPEEPPLIGRITSNRPVDQASLVSRITVKADAASRLFEVECKDITWAVLDSGIDQRHPAFRRENPQPGETESRVVASYELGLLRELLNAAYEKRPEDNPTLDAVVPASGLNREDAVAYLAKAYQSYGTEILDWSSIEPLVRLHDPDPPADGHGTHVAGIIGANWVEGDTIFVKGLCPDIQLMDFRIIGSGLDETEFAVLGALQLVRYLNSQNQHIVVHGVNMSLSIPHKVGSFACGRTPVCNECTRLVGAGVTVVAAAGNLGYRQFSSDGEAFHAYSTLSITDPGNAEDVITVGATHKYEPHAYGISYFSSRGPTPDGRSKPDLVAPGERIVSTLPDEESGPLDGTSQAAPHVSAAAAMLMARYPELNNEPRTIKKILCESATDLGRERAFQGHGLLDILRALQSF
ncbi:MAG TPA: S8 family serine peptidase [Allosphingosinicella sp.]|nr:S8 family serine peptidase [Allosphingosinicella sp.]